MPVSEAVSLRLLYSKEVKMSAGEAVSLRLTLYSKEMKMPAGEAVSLRLTLY
jgi:hypothetical protein